MLTLLLFALQATGAAGPEAIDPASWLGEHDYPMEARRAEAEGRVGVRLTVDRGGRVVNCVVVDSSGREDLDGATCQRVRERGRFRPARTDAGKATEGEIRLAFAWRLTDPPTDDATNAKASMRVRVTAEGAVSSCVEEGDSGVLDVTCRAPQIPPAEMMRLIRGRRETPYMLHMALVRRFGGPTPIIERPADSIALTDIAATFTVNADGWPMPCEMVRDEGRASAPLCGSPRFRFTPLDTGEERRGAIAFAVWITEESE